MGCIRVNWSINKRAYDILCKTSKHSKLHISQIVSNLVIQKLEDPIAALIEDKRQLAIQMNEIDIKIKHLEELKEHNGHQVKAKHLGE